MWLTSLSDKVSKSQAIQLIEATERLEDVEDRNYAEVLWASVETVNKETIDKARMACQEN